MGGRPAIGMAFANPVLHSPGASQHSP
jgi:hypothetical protein